MKIGIITYHHNRNYGSILQTYALMKYLQNQGHDVCIINYVPKGHDTRMEFLGAPEGSIIKKIIYVVGAFPLRLRVHKVYKKFRESYLRLTETEYTSKEDFVKQPLALDLYITGSDQVWCSRCNFHNESEYYGYPYYLDFTSDNEKRISYASSFGEDSLDLRYDAQLSKLIKRYDYLSVREPSGLDKLRSLGRTDGVHVLDPTLLLGRNEWMPLCGSIDIGPKYLLVYEPQRKDPRKFRDYALRIAEHKNLRIVKISKEYWKQPWMDRAIYPSVNDFLRLFADAEFVLTNSFHGIAFCLNFGKQFACIPANTANNRILEMLQMIDLEHRMIDSEDTLGDILSNDIDFKKVDQFIDQKRLASVNYLENAIRMCR